LYFKLYLKRPLSWSGEARKERNAGEEKQEGNPPKRWVLFFIVYDYTD